MSKSILAALAVLSLAPRADAFCGFFVGKADAQLFNKASQVAIVRDGQHTVITMGNDYSGPLTEFALVVPVPSVLQKEQIHLGEKKLLDRLAEYSAPRLVEYTDPDPCDQRRALGEVAKMAPMAAMSGARVGYATRKAMGVTVEASYTVGEYDIVLLSAKDSGGLEAYLRDSGYRIPQRAADALAPYVKQKMKFFVARVNLKEAHGVQQLRPIQIAFDSERFMLPIRLGMANAESGAQDLIVYAMTRKGRVESTNYQTAQMPGDVDVPEFVQKDFGGFYKSAFAQALRSHDGRAVFTEYVWNMGSCDPCSAPPLEQSELAALGVFWLDVTGYHGGGMPLTLTRLHVRYDGEHFPEDLLFQATGDQQPFQARYVLRHPFRGDVSCASGQQYLQQLAARRRAEAVTLAQLTGWSPQSIAQRMGPDAPPAPAQWWKRLWQ